MTVTKSQVSIETLEKTIQIVMNILSKGHNVKTHSVKNREKSDYKLFFVSKYIFYIIFHKLWKWFKFFKQIKSNKFNYTYFIIKLQLASFIMIILDQAKSYNSKQMLTLTEETLRVINFIFGKLKILTEQ
jgi:hypothetical protein